MLECMQWKIFTNNPWQENTVVLHDKTKEAAIIDCGCFTAAERQRLTAFMTENRLKPVVLLNTHLHIDHLFGNTFAREEYGLSARAHEGDAFWLNDFDRYAAMFGIQGMTPPPPLGAYLQEGETVHFGHSDLKVIHVPGHSPGGVCFYCEAAKLLVAGDVLFQGSIGRADLPGGNPQELTRGIREKLFMLPDDVTVIPGHGPCTTIGEEKRTNPFF